MMINNDVMSLVKWDKFSTFWNFCPTIYTHTHQFTFMLIYQSPSKLYSDSISYKRRLIFNPFRTFAKPYMLTLINSLSCPFTKVLASCLVIVGSFSCDLCSVWIPKHLPTFGIKVVDIISLVLKTRELHTLVSFHLL